MRLRGNALPYLILWLILVVSARTVIALPDAEGEAQLANGGVSVYFSPDPVQIGLGLVQTVDIVVENVHALYAAEVRVSYPPELVQVCDLAGAPTNSILPGDLFDGVGIHTILNRAEGGAISYIVSIAASPSGIDGGGILATIPLKAISPVASSGVLAFVEVILAERNGTEIVVDMLDDEAIIYTVGETATPTATPTATRTPTNTPVPTPTTTATATPTVSGTIPAATATATATASATPSATATSTPQTPTPTPSTTAVLVCANYIINGGFETVVDSTAPPWVSSPLVNFTLVEQHSGQRSAWLGGYNGASDTLCQQVSIPEHPEPGQDTVQALLTYAWGMVTQETTHPFDLMYLRLRDTSGALLATLHTLSDGSIAGSWQVSPPFDLLPYRGQTLNICFEVETNGSNATSFYVDDVELNICESLLPTATPTATPSPTMTPTPEPTQAPTATPTITPTPIEVTLQNVTGGYQGCEDSFLDSWYPTQPHGHEGAFSIRTFGVKRPVIRFDLSDIPSGVTILEARLWLHASHYKSAAHPLTISAYGLKRPWLEGEATWNEASAGVAWGAGGAEDTATDRDETPAGSFVLVDTSTWYSMDIAGLVQEWIDGTRPNYGVLLLASGLTVETSFWSSEYSVQSKHPKLVVRYTYGAAPGPTATPTPTVTGTAGPSPTPTFTPTPGGVQRTFQEGELGYTGVEDTYIDQWDPGGTIKRGYDAKVAVRQGGVFKTLIRFDLSSLPADATIQEAKLGLYAYGRSNSGALDVTVRPVLRSWAEGQATWNLAATGVPWAQPGCSEPDVDVGDPAATRLINTINTWHEWDITALVQNWVANPASNRGVLLQGAGSTSVEYLFASSDYWWDLAISPRLIVRYTTP